MKKLLGATLALFIITALLGGVVLLQHNGLVPQRVWAASPITSAAPLAPTAVEAPQIVGATNIMVMEGETPDYLQGVRAQDAQGNSLELHVDATGVDIATPGSYTLTYSAVDAAGNTAQQTIGVTVLNTTETEVNVQVDDVLSGILTDAMGGREKARAIFNWITENLRYTPQGDRGSVYTSAGQALTLGRGDCYNFYALAEVMLKRAGIETVGVKRVEANTCHYWNLVNLGDGWYHFDTCPTPEAFDGFLFGEAQAQQFTQQMGDGWRYYEYDPSLYPTVEWE